MSVIILDSWRKKKEMTELAELVAKADNLRQLNNEIDRVEEELKILKQRQSKLSEHEIPAMMEELGMAEFKLSDNFKVTIRPVYFGKVIGSEGYNWLRDQGFGDIVKAKLEIPYDFTQPEISEMIKEYCASIGMMCINNTSVHHMTMGAFLKEQAEAGREMPKDKIQVYAGKKTYIR